MTADANPAVHREALRRQIEQARTRAGVSHGQAARALGWSLPDLLLVAAVVAGFDDGRLPALLDHYGIAAENIGDLRAPAASPLSKPVQVLVQYERMATIVTTFEPFVIPGLLQTRAYAECVLRLYAPPEDLGSLVDARLARQDVFQSQGMPEMIFLIDQSALHRWAGATGDGPAVMREQLEHVRQMALHPRVRIQVISYAAGVHEGVKGPFVVLESADPLLYLEDAKGDVISADAERVGQHRERFEELTGAAAAPQDLAGFLDRASEGLA